MVLRVTQTLMGLHKTIDELSQALLSLLMVKLYHGHQRSKNL